MPSHLVATMHVIIFPDELNPIHPCNYMPMSHASHAHVYLPYASMSMPMLMLISPHDQPPCPHEVLQEKNDFLIIEICLMIATTIKSSNVYKLTCMGKGVW